MKIGAKSTYHIHIEPKIQESGIKLTVTLKKSSLSLSSLSHLSRSWTSLLRD